MSEPTPSPSPGTPARPHWAPETNRAPAMRAVIPAVIITAALIAAVLLVVFWSPGAAAETQVYMETENGRLVVAAASVEIGQTKTREDGGTSTEQIAWTRLGPADGPQDTRDGPVRIAEGEARGEGYTEVRIVFKEVKLARGGNLDVLQIPQDTIQVRLAEPGAAGDALLIALDVERSIVDENGFLSFRPHIVDTLWEPQGATKDTPPVRTPAHDGGNDAPGKPVTPRDPRPPTAITSDSGASSGGSSPKPPQVGRLHVAFVGNATGLVDSLNISVGKIGLTSHSEPEDVITVHESGVGAELVRDPQQGVAELAAIQVRPGTYTSLHFEFTHADATILRNDPKELVIPQPWLVLEAPFTIQAGEVVGVIIEFGVEESIRIGLSGLEFRPVILDYITHDSEGRDITEPYPAQYRTGGGWLPSLGEKTNEAIREYEIDPDAIPHPIYNDQDRDLRSEGGLLDVDAEELEEVLKGTTDELDDAMGDPTGSLTDDLDGLL